jgi:hypothetical protein
LKLAEFIKTQYDSLQVFLSIKSVVDGDIGVEILTEEATKCS